MASWNMDGAISGPPDQSYFPPVDNGQDHAMGGVEAEPEATGTVYNNGYQDVQAPYNPQPSSHSADYAQQPYGFSPAAEVDPNARYPASNPYQQPQPTQQPPQHVPRPPSDQQLAMDRERQAYAHLQADSRQVPYQESIPRAPPQHVAEPSSKSKDSVVIKVGMVGDAQIGKTSLMVKYVEGSWDEDYIQTLGKRSHAGIGRTRPSTG